MTRSVTMPAGPIFDKRRALRPHFTTTSAFSVNYRAIFQHLGTVLQPAKGTEKVSCPSFRKHRFLGPWRTSRAGQPNAPPNNRECAELRQTPDQHALADTIARCNAILGKRARSGAWRNARKYGMFATSGFGVIRAHPEFDPAMPVGPIIVQIPARRPRIEAMWAPSPQAGSPEKTARIDLAELGFGRSMPLALLQRHTQYARSHRSPISIVHPPRRGRAQCDDGAYPRALKPPATEARLETPATTALQDVSIVVVEATALNLGCPELLRRTCPGQPNPVPAQRKYRHPDLLVCSLRQEAREREGVPQQAARWRRAEADNAATGTGLLSTPRTMPNTTDLDSDATARTHNICSI